MDKKVLSAAPPPIEERCEIKCSQDYSPETFLSNDKKTHDDATPATPSKKVSCDCATPAAPSKKVSFDCVTPSPTSNKREGTSSSNQVANSTAYSSVTAALLALNLASNATSHSSFRPKRRSHHAPNGTSIFPPLKRESKVSHFNSPSLPDNEMSSASKVRCASASSFTAILTSASIESRLKPPKLKKIKETKKKKTSNLEKKDFHMSTIFSSSKSSSATFCGILKKSAFASYSIPPNENDKFITSSEHLFSKFKCSPKHHGHIHETNGNVSESMTSDLTSHASSKCSSRNTHESKFEHLKNSRFVSTSFIFRKRDASSNENILSSTSNAYPSFSKCSTHRIEGISKFDPSTKSSPIFKDNLDSKHPPF